MQLNQPAQNELDNALSFTIRKEQQRSQLHSGQHDLMQMIDSNLPRNCGERTEQSMSSIALPWIVGFRGLGFRAIFIHPRSHVPFATGQFCTAFSELSYMRFGDLVEGSKISGLM